MKCWVLLLCMIIALTSCTQKSQSKQITFGFLIHSLSNSRWQIDVNNIQERSAEKGINCIIKNADGNENLQAQQAKELIAQGVDALVIVAANANTAAQIVRLSKKSGIPIIAYDRLVQNCDLDYVVSYDYIKIGELLANYVFSKIKSGNIVLLYGDSDDANAIMVTEGIEKTIQKVNTQNQYNIVFKTNIEDWSYKNAEYDFSKVVNCYPHQIDGVIACNVPLALATVDVLKNNGLDPSKTIITAQDSNDEILQSIKNNEANMTVMKSIKDLSYKLVDIIEKVVSGNGDIEINGYVNNRQKNVSAILLTPYVLDISNIEQINEN